MSTVPPLAHAHLDDPAAKLAYNRLHFAEAAPHYDLATKVLSFGRDVVWKHHLIAALPSHATRCLDLACGTGDLCFSLADRFPEAQIEGIDLTPAMLEIAAQRNPAGERIGFMQGDICALPQGDATVDVVTGAYALRNAPDLAKALAEVERVLKPGGIAAFLDFSKSPSRSSQRLQGGLLRFWGGLWGLLLHGNSSVHGYIAASLRTYPTRPQLAALFEAQAFDLTASRLFFHGMTQLTVLQKRPPHVTTL